MAERVTRYKVIKMKNILILQVCGLVCLSVKQLGPVLQQLEMLENGQIMKFKYQNVPKAKLYHLKLTASKPNDIFNCNKLNDVILTVTLCPDLLHGILWMCR